jgi:Mn2+/Fe2+ NRAMP family transporter
VQLPFALIPLIKFASQEKIMGPFKMSKAATVFATAFGIFLFLMNFVLLFNGTDFNTTEIILIVLVAIVYISFCLSVVMEPVKPLKKMTREEYEDHEFDRVIIDSEISGSFDSDI